MYNPPYSGQDVMLFLEVDLSLLVLPLTTRNFNIYFLLFICFRFERGAREYFTFKASFLLDNFTTVVGIELISLVGTVGTTDVDPLVETRNALAFSTVETRYFFNSCLLHC